MTLKIGSLQTTTTIKLQHHQVCLLIIELKINYNQDIIRSKIH